jgi:hypothetical protein
MKTRGNMKNASGDMMKASGDVMKCADGDDDKRLIYGYEHLLTMITVYSVCVRIFMPARTQLKEH